METIDKKKAEEVRVFFNTLRKKIEKALRIKDVLHKQRKQLLLRLNDNPGYATSEEFRKKLSQVVKNERRIHRYCESGIEEGIEEWKKIAGIVEKPLKKNKSDVSKYTLKYIKLVNKLFPYLEKRLAKMDKRLVHEERFLETGKKKDFIRFLKEYRKELKEDERLIEEVQDSRIEIDKVSNNIRHKLKKAGIKVSAGVAVPAALPLGIVGYPFVKFLHALLQPAADFIVRALMRGAQGYHPKKESFGKRFRKEVDLMPLVGRLITVIESKDYTRLPERAGELKAVRI